MGKNSFYLGEVGNATKMNLVLQTMMGVTLAGLAEGMALADRAGLQQKVVTSDHHYYYQDFLTIT